MDARKEDRKQGEAKEKDGQRMDIEEEENEHYVDAKEEDDQRLDAKGNGGHLVDVKEEDKDDH